MSIKNIRERRNSLLLKIEEYKKNQIYISPIIENGKLVSCEVYIESEKYLGTILNQTNIDPFTDFLYCLDLIEKNKTDLKKILTQSTEEYKKSNYYKSVSLINKELQRKIEEYIRKRLYEIKDKYDIVIIPSYCDNKISSISIKHLFNGEIEEASLDVPYQNMDIDIALTINYQEALNDLGFKENEEVEKEIKNNIKELLDPIYPHNTSLDLIYDLITAREKFEIMFLKSIGLFLKEVFI